ncbi:MobA/MobL family protein [Xanthomonas axonopodis]|nr:MobA/MobL family protein [Xanthomonas axonopodis]
MAIGQALVARYGFALQASIHSPGSRDGLNHHVHLLATTRRLTRRASPRKRGSWTAERRGRLRSSGSAKP